MSTPNVTTNAKRHRSKSGCANPSDSTPDNCRHFTYLHHFWHSLSNVHHISRLGDYYTIPYQEVIFSCRELWKPTDRLSHNLHHQRSPDRHVEHTSLALMQLVTYSKLISIQTFDVIYISRQRLGDWCTIPRRTWITIQPKPPTYSLIIKIVNG